MALSKLTKLVLLAGAATTAVAFESITIDSTVKADEEVEVKVTNDLEASDSFDATFEEYRVYLATTPPGWGTGPACYLVNATKIDTTSVKVTVPASIAPDGTVLQIATMEFNEDPSKDGPSGFQYSNEFTLEGGNGEWSKVELDGSNIGLSDFIPCSAYKCARECASKFYPDYLESESAYKDAYECTRECDGVEMPSYAAISGEEDPSSTEDGASPSATGDGSDATDAPGAAGHFLVSIPLAMLGTVAAITCL